MNPTIYKYTVGIKHEQAIRVHASAAADGGLARVVHVGSDPTRGGWSLWIEVDPDSEIGEVPLYVYGTGHAIDASAGNHIGTIIDGAYLWHFYSPKLRKMP